MNRHASRMPSVWIALLCAYMAGVGIPAAAPIYRADDPLSREPETQDASAVQEWTIDLFIDLATNLFGQPGDRDTGVHAANVNTADEVPDSSWFTNRILARPVSSDEAARGPQEGEGPAPGEWTIIGSKEIGFSPGFTIRDTRGEVWFVTFDPRGHPDAATAAILIANKIFWTLGYWQVDNRLTRVLPAEVVIGETATVRPMSGTVRRMRPADLEDVWARAHRSEDGSYRAVAARRLPGRPLGGFRYAGTRPDDPNDLVPHEHRRELRALRVFGAWTNLTDMKAGNTLDVLVGGQGHGRVRHYLQDVGSTFGFGALGPIDFDEGWEHLYEGNLVWKRLVSVGFLRRPWQTVAYAEHTGIGRFEGGQFDPTTWKPRAPTAAFRHAQPADLFWAARRVMAFSDGMIAALVRTGAYGDPAAERHLTNVLIERRNKIGTAYLTAVNPLVDFELSADGRLSFRNAAVAAGVAQPPLRGYRTEWATFDNVTGISSPLRPATIATSEESRAERPLPAGEGAHVRVRVSHIEPMYESGKAAVAATFRRTGSGWRLVALERQAK
jgi:hypothetical protein